MHRRSECLIKLWFLLAWNVADPGIAFAFNWSNEPHCKNLISKRNKKRVFFCHLQMCYSPLLTIHCGGRWGPWRIKLNTVLLLHPSSLLLPLEVWVAIPKNQQSKSTRLPVIEHCRDYWTHFSHLEVCLLLKALALLASVVLCCSVAGKEFVQSRTN